MQLAGLVETRWRIFWQFYCSVTQVQKTHVGRALVECLIDAASSAEGGRVGAIVLEMSSYLSFFTPLRPAKAR
jgi:hypothetical protein